MCGFSLGAQELVLALDNPRAFMGIGTFHTSSNPSSEKCKILHTGLNLIE